MSQPAIGPADFLRVMHALPQGHWESACQALGLVLVPKAREAKARAASAEPAGASEPQAPSPPAAADGGTDEAPATPAASPPAVAQTFWRVESDLTGPEAQEDVPDWAISGPEPVESEFDGDFQAVGPAPIPLARPGQVAAFFRRHLARPRTTGSVDMRRLLRTLLRQQPLRRLPLQTRPRWPARLQVIYDTHPGLHPLHADIAPPLRQLKRTLGPRLRLLLAQGYPGNLRDAADRPAHPPDEPPPRATLALDAGPVVVFGDAGMNQPAGAALDHWVQLARRLAAAGPRPLLLAPVPRRMVPPEVAAAFDTALLGDGPSLNLLRGCRGPLPDPAQEPQHDLAVLRAALFGNPWVTPPLLRELRLALADQGLRLDVGSESELWQDRAVSATPLACTLLGEQRAEARAAFAALPEHLRCTAARVHWHHLAVEAPLVQAEYARSVHALLPPQSAAAVALAEGLERARRLAERACAALWRGGAPWVAGLAAHFGRLGVRSSDLVADGEDALQAAWALAHRDALAQGRIQPLPSLRSDRLAWVFRQDQQRPRRVALTLAGRADALQLQLHDEADPAAPAARLVNGLKAPWVAVGEAQVVALGLGQRLNVPSVPAIRLQAGARKLVLQSFTKPEWAHAIEFDGDHWRALAPDSRWLIWVPQSQLWSFSKVHGRPIETPVGAWWDADVLRSFLSDAGKVAAWADRSGIDNTGLWAEIKFDRTRQRLRWLPPGQFLMGSPYSEPDRGSDEIPHEVMLTAGYWIAETACTQALWEAVMGSNPSRFSGRPKNPVENVSWRDVVEGFLRKINQLVPGLNLRLPSEAEWEYACRAGTNTAFSFGDWIGTDIANYDGNPPYAGGATGQRRGRPVAVKSLPVNPWGLYEMHGNVWEWCQDQYGEYPDTYQIDPVSGAGLRGVPHVLRGGCWSGGGGSCRSSRRSAGEPDGRNGGIGFRLARDSTDDV